jgi:hypothetical protein
MPFSSVSICLKGAVPTVCTALYVRGCPLSFPERTAFPQVGRALSPTVGLSGSLWFCQHWLSPEGLFPLFVAALPAGG